MTDEEKLYEIAIRLVGYDLQEKLGVVLFGETTITDNKMSRPIYLSDGRTIEVQATIR